MVDISANVVGSVVSVCHGVRRLGLLGPGGKTGGHLGADRRRRVDELPVGAGAAPAYADVKDWSGSELALPGSP